MNGLRQKYRKREGRERGGSGIGRGSEAPPPKEGSPLPVIFDPGIPMQTRASALRGGTTAAIRWNSGRAGTSWKLSTNGNSATSGSATSVRSRPAILNVESSQRWTTVLGHLKHWTFFCPLTCPCNYDFWSTGVITVTFPFSFMPEAYHSGL